MSGFGLQNQFNSVIVGSQASIIDNWPINCFVIGLMRDPLPTGGMVQCCFPGTPSIQALFNAAVLIQQHYFFHPLSWCLLHGHENCFMRDDYYLFNKNIFLGSDQLSILMKNSRYVHVYFFFFDFFLLGFCLPF